ncbi:hypothetical protein GCM10009579_05570 [Streptomyces javensis]|uniref:Uncharacterized protein n=1 Tax=Streptomyces javensis TaxID=114698 RepID=A0ABN1WHK9_9ACTN
MIALDTVCGETPARRATMARVTWLPLGEGLLVERGIRVSGVRGFEAWFCELDLSVPKALSAL